MTQGNSGRRRRISLSDCATVGFSDGCRRGGERGDDAPDSGLRALLVLVTAVVQTPTGVAMIPPITIDFSTASTTVAIAFTIWCVVVGLADNVLKPMRFGRGVELVIIVIFLGAIGGMWTMGIIYLFVGAVVLGVGYELFNAWIDAVDDAQSDARSNA
jgi:predicted PurR-regulated permease PerM